MPGAVPRHCVVPLQPATLHATITFPNASFISLSVMSVGGGCVDTPTASRSSISLTKDWGTLSSVARIVSRTICQGVSVLSKQRAIYGDVPELYSWAPASKGSRTCPLHLCGGHWLRRSSSGSDPPHRECPTGSLRWSSV